MCMVPLLSSLDMNYYGMFVFVGLLYVWTSIAWLPAASLVSLWNTQIICQINILLLQVKEEAVQFQTQIKIFSQGFGWGAEDGKDCHISEEAVFTIGMCHMAPCNMPQKEVWPAGLSLLSHENKTVSGKGQASHTTGVCVRVCSGLVSNVSSCTELTPLKTLVLIAAPSLQICEWSACRLLLCKSYVL